MGLKTQKIGLETSRLRSSASDVTDILSSVLNHKTTGYLSPLLFIHLVIFVEPLRVLLYARVSKEIGMTVENQVPILENWARMNGYLFETIVEEESTRKTLPIRQEVIARLRTRQVDGVACIRLDRFLRSMNEIVLLDELINKGAKLFFIKQGLEFTKENMNAMAKMQLGMLVVFADVERELIRERTLEGLARARAQGKKPGRPFGSKDKGARRKSGYWARWAGKKAPPANQALSTEVQTKK
jgi:DNA invertase Pin-like site-specific DNA recombinase